nr:transposase [Halobacterium sp. CBA1126]
MPIEKAGNPLFDDYGKHFDFSLHLCQTGGTPEGELENFADNRGLQTYTDIWGDAETFRNDIYRVPIVAWRAKFNEWTNRLLDAVYGDELRARELPVAVDATNIPTWTNEESDLAGVIGTEKMDNTHFAYRILNAQVVSDGMPFQIAHELQMDSADREDRLEDLIERVRDRGFNIGVLLVDSEFASGKVVNRLKSLDVDFVISYPKRHVTKYTDEWEADRTTFGIEENYVIRKDATPPTRAETTLFGEYQSKLGGYTDEAQKRLSDFFNPEAEWLTGRQNQQTLAAYEDHFEEDIFEANNRMRWFTFVTNLDVGEEEARALREYYHYRWAIESAFSDYKQNFLPTTKSTNLGMRVYLYLFGMAAYNSWIAANTKARRQHLEDSERNRPPIRASRFTTLGQQRYRDEFHRDYISFSED